MKHPYSEAHSRLSRRTVFAGAGAVGAAVVAAHFLPVSAPTEIAQKPDDAAPDGGGGYRLSEHIQKYYKTIRV